MAQRTVVTHWGQWDPVDDLTLYGYTSLPGTLWTAQRAAPTQRDINEVAPVKAAATLA